MALTIPQLQALRETLIRARLAGVREIRDQNGETVAYKSDREMASALANAEAMIAQLQTGATPNVLYFKVKKGI